MNKLKTASKWVLFNTFWVALAWAGYEQGMVWCENLFLFYTWFMFIFSTIGAVLLAVMKHLINSPQHTITNEDEFYSKLVHVWQVPHIFSMVLDFLMITYLASKGFFVMAIVVSGILIVQYVVRSILKEFRNLAIQRQASLRLRPNNVQGSVPEAIRIPDPDDVFSNDDSDLFRMGITSSPPPSDDD